MIQAWWHKVSGRLHTGPSAAGEPDGAAGTSRWLSPDSDWDDTQSDGIALAQVRDEFEWAIRDVDGGTAATLRGRIRRAAGRPELWYLRAQLFDAIARHHTQQTAQARLQPLNRFFRQSQSGPVPL